MREPPVTRFPQPPACKLIIDPRELFWKILAMGWGGDQVSNYCQQAEEEDNMGARKIRSLSLLPSNHSTLKDNALVVLAEIARLERRIFPKHESLAGDFSQEVKKRNQKLLYVIQGDVVTEQKEHEEEKLDPTLIAGYLMYSWSSLAASITKLAEQAAGVTDAEQNIWNCHSFVRVVAGKAMERHCYNQQFNRSRHGSFSV
ncbi:hypothetical protein CY35_03G025200 [Sphagnum magellanicum]|nr:hypothetical protein CY35_03G025200 [Sphagnum magellanicum]